MAFCSLNQSYKLFRLWVFLRPFSVMLFVVVMVGALLMVQTKMKDFTFKNEIFVQFNEQEKVLVKNLELKKLQNWSNDGENVLISNNTIHKNGIFVQFNGQEEILVKNLEPKKLENWSSEAQNVQQQQQPPSIIPHVESGEGKMYAALPLPFQGRETVSDVGSGEGRTYAALPLSGKGSLSGKGRETVSDVGSWEGRMYAALPWKGRETVSDVGSGEGRMYAALPLAGKGRETVSDRPSAKEGEGQNVLINNSPYYNWELFVADYEEMMKTLKIFVYPDAFMSNKSSPFSSIFLPLTNPFDPKLGNYFSEHMFKIALLGSSLVTQNPKEAHFYYMPFSINVMRNHPRVHSAAAIEDFVAGYTDGVRSEFSFWNASGGADHFYVYCHSIGRDAASKHQELHHNAIQVTCSSNYFQRLYVAHKDIGLPQVWPRQHEELLNPPDARYKLVFFAGRVQNSLARRDLLELWKNDSSFDIFSGSSSFPYKEGFRRSRYCLHVKGYEVNTARVSDAIQHGCVPVMISNYYDLPLANVLDWSKFSIIVNERDIPHLKKILLSVPKRMYLDMYKNLGIVRRHFAWYSSPKNYDSFHMTVYQLWLRRGLHRVAW